MNSFLQKFCLLAAVVLMDVLGGVELELFVPSFPEIQQQFNLSPVWVEAILSVNFVGYFLSLLFVGNLADRYGRKSLILWGIIILMIGSGLCLYAPSYEYLLVGRFLQGLGVAAPAILSYLIVADLYSLKDQQFYMAMLSGVANISVGAGPVLGSYITLYFRWQGNFMALLILACITLVMTFIFVPSHFPLKEEYKEGYALIFKSTPVMLILTFFIFFASTYWIFTGMSSLLYIEGMGVNLAHFGYYQGVLATIYALGSMVAGVVIGRYNQKHLLKISGWICGIAVGLLFLMAAVDMKNPLLITTGLLFYIIGGIFPGAILYPLCLNILPQAKGRVAAMIQGGRLVFTAVAIEIAGFYYSGTFRSLGIILGIVLAAGLVMLVLILKNKDLGEHLETKDLLAQ